MTRQSDTPLTQQDHERRQERTDARPTDTRTGDRARAIPDGVPAHVPLSAAAAALDLTDGKVRGWADRGDIPVLQRRPNATRYVPTCWLKQLEDEGWIVDWLTLIDLHDT